MKEEENRENLDDERHRSRQPDGCDARRGAYDDASRQTNEASDREKRLDDVQAACGLLDKINRIKADSNVCLYVWDNHAKDQEMIETALRIVYKIVCE